MNSPVAVITGLGLVTPLGTDNEAFFSRLTKGQTGIRKIQAFDPEGLPCTLAAEAADFNAQDFIHPRSMRKMDRISHLAVGAAKLALGDAGLELTDDNRDRVGVVLSTAYGSTETAVKMAQTIYTGGPRKANPIIVPNSVMNAPAGNISIELKLRGVNSTVNHNAASAETAIAFGAAQVISGRADAVLAGGVEVIGAFFYEVLTRFWALSGSKGGQEAARPFDKNRNGWIFGEGAGLVLIESEQTALNRGARPYARIEGWGLASGPAPLNDWADDPAGPTLSIQRALKTAGLGPKDVGFVSASANGSQKLDRLEAGALARVFGSGPKGPLVSSVKGHLGESFSSGGIRTAAAALSLKKGLLPPTLGLEEPEFDLNFTKQTASEIPAGRALITGFSAGGTYASLILGKED